MKDCNKQGIKVIVKSATKEQKYLFLERKFLTCTYFTTS